MRARQLCQQIENGRNEVAILGICWGDVSLAESGERDHAVEVDVGLSEGIKDLTDHFEQVYVVLRLLLVL